MFFLIRFPLLDYFSQVKLKCRQWNFDAGNGKSIWFKIIIFMRFCLQLIDGRIIISYD